VWASKVEIRNLKLEKLEIGKWNWKMKIAGWKIETGNW
jgi:hypothetical protein